MAKIRWGIIGLSSIIVGLSVLGYIVLTDDELDHSYRCTTTTKIGVFENLSKTNTTGYWYVNETRKSSTCTKGKWEYLRTWCKNNNISNCGRIEATAKEDVYTGIIWCTDKCDPIVN